jgi:hypothetical protein
MSCGLKPLDENTIKDIKVNGKDYIEYNKQYYKVPKSRQLSTKCKNIADVVGIKITTKGYRESGKYKHKETLETVCIEAKASLADFKHGYCYGANKNYVIAPIGIIPKEFIHSSIGLIEVDLDNFKIINTKKAIEFEGINITKRCKKKKCGDYKTEEEYQEVAKDLMIYTAKRSTNEMLFWNNKVPLYTRTK